MFLHNEMGVSWEGMSLMCGRSSIHPQKIFFLRSIAGRFATSPSMMRYRLEKLSYISVQENVISHGPHCFEQIPLL